MTKKAIRDAFGEALVAIGIENPEIVVVSCDLKSATKTKDFFKKFPERSFEVGIAEANGIGVSAGLALAGYRPFITSFGSFITGKNLEICMSIAYNNAPVVVVGTHGGLIGPDGTTQAGLRDITTMRAIPGFIILQPCSAIETKAMVEYLATTNQAAYLRIARNEVSEVYDSNYEFKLGQALVLRQGSDISLVTSGPMVQNCLQAAEELSSVMSVRVINLPTLKPLDRMSMLDALYGTHGIVTVEDHTIEGGLGSIVSEIVAECGLSMPTLRHGIMDVFTESGTPSDLEKKYELDASGIAKAALELFSRIKSMQIEGRVVKSESAPNSNLKIETVSESAPIFPSRL